MNVRTRPPRPALAACLGLVGLVGLVALGGCSVASGPLADNAAVGQVRTGAAAEKFAAFPVQATWNGLHNVVFQQIVKPKSGTAARNFRVITRSEMAFWLNCIGSGTVQLDSPAMGLKWSVPCGNGDDPRGLNITPRAASVGHGADIGVTVSAGSRWEVRIDGIAPSGVAPPPPPIPSRTRALARPRRLRPASCPTSGRASGWTGGARCSARSAGWPRRGPGG
jgi:hypothetical protein